MKAQWTFTVFIAALVGPGIAEARCISHAADRDSASHEALALFSEGLYSEVIRYFEQSPFDSLTPQAAFYLGSSYGALGEFQNSIRHIRRAVTLEPSNRTYRYQLARTLAQGGLMRDARLQFETLADDSVPFIPALAGYGALLFDEGDFPEAAAIFARSIALNPRDYVANYYLGMCCDRMGQSDTALTFLAASISLNPHYTPATRLLASLYYSRREYDRALLLYERLCQQKPRVADFWYKAGLCSEKTNSERLAVDLFRRAAALDTTEALYHAHLGQLFFSLGMLDTALFEFREASFRDPDNPVLLLNAGLCLARMDSTKQAIAVLRRAVAAHHVEKVAQVYTQIGAVYYNKERYREALRAYSDALSFDRKNPDALFFIGFTYEQLHQVSSAQSAFERFLKTAGKPTPTDPSLKKRVETVNRRLKKLRGHG